MEPFDPTVTPCERAFFGCFVDGWSNRQMNSERELAFTFAICCRPSVRRLSVSVSATLVHPTQAVVNFSNFSTAFGTLAIH